MRTRSTEKWVFFSICFIIQTILKSCAPLNILITRWLVVTSNCFLPFNFIATMKTYVKWNYIFYIKVVYVDEQIKKIYSACSEIAHSEYEHVLMSNSHAFFALKLLMFKCTKLKTRLLKENIILPRENYLITFLGDMENFEAATKIAAH